MNEKFLLSVVTLALAVACTPPHQDVTTPPAGPTVIVAGTYFNQDLGKNQATVWVNGVRSTVGGTQQSEVTGMDVAAGRVYLVGSQGNPGTNILWEDGTPTVLPLGPEDVRVRGGATYVAGIVFNGSENQASLWIDGNLETVCAVESLAVSVAVTDTMIYVAGSKFDGVNYYLANLWWRPLSGGAWQSASLHQSGYRYSEAVSVAYGSGRVAVATRQYHEAQDTYHGFVYEGTDPNALTGRQLSTPSAHTKPEVFVSRAWVGSSTYVVGSYRVDDGAGSYFECAAVWVDDQNPILYPAGSNQDSIALDVVVFGGDVYVTGNVMTEQGGEPFFQPCYWKNGVRLDLPSARPGMSSMDLPYLGAMLIRVW